MRAKKELLTELQVLLAELLEATEQTGGRPHFPLCLMLPGTPPQRLIALIQSALEVFTLCAGLGEGCPA